MVLARDVVGLETRGPVRAVRLEGGDEIEARSVVLATGVSYRRLDAPGLDALTGRGVYYGANASEAAASARATTSTSSGAANSAGQAALNLARYAERVVLVVRGRGARGDACRSTSSSGSAAAEHRGALPHRGRRRGAATATSSGSPSPTGDTGATRRSTPSWLFVFIGASPRTDWLGADVVRDDHGFVVTGHDLVTGRQAHRWPLARPPFALETSVPGVFAAGDVRLDSMKRVASAVGEGAMSVYLVHRYLATI